jgi:hypothetical protein
MPPPFASLGYFMPDLVPKNLASSSNSSVGASMCGGGSSSSYALHGARISSSQIDTYIRRYSHLSPSFPPDSFDRIMKLLSAAGAWCMCDVGRVMYHVSRVAMVVPHFLAERLYWDARGSGSSQDCAHAAAAYANHARYALHVCR